MGLLDIERCSFRSGIPRFEIEGQEGLNDNSNEIIVKPRRGFDGLIGDR